MEGGPDGSARTRVHRIRKNVLKFTDKKVSVTNPKKYTIGNILKMYQYLDWVPTIPLISMEYKDASPILDSAWFFSRIWGRTQRPPLVERSSQAFVIQMDTVMAAYEAGMFVRGDKLILDNARVHTARCCRTAESATGRRRSRAAFGMVKSFMRKDRGGGSFFTEIIHAFAVAITRPKIYKAYLHCLP
eukprot:g53043.t1